MGEEDSGINENHLDRLWALIDDAVAQKDEKRRRLAIEEVTMLAENLAREEPSAETLYSLGYILYFHAERKLSISVQKRVEGALSSALEIDPTYARAWLYLGHHSYDLGEFALAKQRFEEIRAGDLPPYLDLKAKEMRLCCAIKLQGLDATMLELKRFIAAAASRPEEDIWPRELATCLKEALPSCGPSLLPQLRMLVKQLDEAGNFGAWFSEIVEQDH